MDTSRRTTRSRCARKLHRSGSPEIEATQQPADLRRRCAAATTLYGTEAAAGVIQIFTKRGTAGGEPVWDATIEQGFSDPNEYGIPETLRGTPTSDFPQAISEAGGNVDYMFHDPWLRHGYQQRYGLSVRGNTNPISYSVSGQFEDLENMFVDSGARNYSLHSNTSLQVTDELNFDLMTLYSNRNISSIACGNNVQGVCMNAPRAPTNYIGSGTFEELDKLVSLRDDVNEINRLITGATVRYQPLENLNARVAVGYDRAGSTGRITADYGHPSAPLGYIALNQTLEELTTIDLATTYNLRLGSNFSTDVSSGFQFITRQNSWTEGYAQDFPGPGEMTLSGGAISQSRETRSKVVTGGFFGQMLFGYLDRFFLTTGVRLDGNSAFGQEFGWAAYPKVSASWIVSDEGFWPQAFGDLKLRAAWGTAGRAPGAFDAVRTWSAVPWGSQSSFIPENVGNPELGPETTAETEVGFELSTLEGRLNLDFTYYRQITSDALVPVRQIPTNGTGVPSSRTWASSAIRESR
ncbi:MAG: TonB-dependent receptor [Gemmatimonas sp.]|nr:TonB-dependent receptor [Gemmatimonas sp.]